MASEVPPEATPAHLSLGLDVGSTTVKVVLLDGDDRIVYEEYRRHHADIRVELINVLDDALSLFPAAVVRTAVTGSGGLGVATLTGVPFVQEVIAGTEAIRRRHPETDVVIELGGEDAKITYLGAAPEQRMNGTCAGGTGAFIDQMAALLRTDAKGLDALAEQARNRYPIASRCGVFAKSDLQPLINEGAPPEDLAASIFHAVAAQTIAGLACGRPIRGSVALLGGPLFFLPQLRKAFADALDGATDLITPRQAQLYVALGAAMLADGEPEPLTDLLERVRASRGPDSASGRLRPLFATTREHQEFLARHARAEVPRVTADEVGGPCFLGVDAGSTTFKAVLIDDRARIVRSYYSGNDGDPVGSAVRAVSELQTALPPGATIVRSCVTGYGEGLVKAALNVDDGEVETMAHLRAAQHVAPGATEVIDIGGQDMKYLRIRNGVIDSIAVNEACSSGCGSFLQSFAETMRTDVHQFAEAACASFAPVDLGSRCTVFMNSAVKQAQKESSTLGDIAAGLSYSVVRNALQKVIKLRDASQLGDTVVVQGGTFLNDAVLRAFELLVGRDVVRPDIAGLMGAFGAALIARDRWEPHRSEPALQQPKTALLSGEALQTLTVSTSTDNCQLCQNRCQRTVSTFSEGKRHVSGNRCDRGGDEPVAADDAVPNLFATTYQRLFGYRRLAAKDAPRGDLGIPRALNLYENYPFWFTVLTRLGFRVVVSGRSGPELIAKGMDSIASENICYPAKLAHGHVADLVGRGVQTIFYPCIPFEQKLVQGTDDHFSCPVVAGYPQVVRANLDTLRERDVRFLEPFLNLSDPASLAKRLPEVFADWDVSAREAADAVRAGYAEDAAVRADVRAAGAAALDRLRETGRRGIVLAGRPYHVDPEIHHGIPELITGLGLAVFTVDSVLGHTDGNPLERPLRVRDQWAYHSRLYEAAAVVAARDDLHLVQLTSFGCGLDAVTSDQVQEILEAKDDVYTTLKIDEVSNLGAARIRLRSLAAATQGRPAPDTSGTHVVERPVFTPEMRERHTLLVPQLSPIHLRLMEAALTRGGYRLEVLETVDPEDVETGLRFVHNDACYPAILVIGQLVNAFRSGRYDPADCSVMITQTGGMCRATNYTGLLRKALREAGYGHVPVVAVSTTGIEKNPGFSLTLPILHRLVRAVVLGDLLQTLLLRVRPYEREAGSASALYDRWNDTLREYLLGRPRRARYADVVREVVRDFDALPLHDVPRRPRVGVVGEILVKFHPDANHHVVDVIEREGYEAVLPGLAEFVLSGTCDGDWNHRHLGIGGWDRYLQRIVRSVIERSQAPVRAALAATDGKFSPPTPIGELADRAATITSRGNQAGEGWLLTGEMLELLDHGVPNIVCAQPFACLPNHVTGKGMFREIRRQHPEANIVAVDYDPGASEVNQLNRIKLMLAMARSTPASSAENSPEASPATTHDLRHSSDDALASGATTAGR